MFGEDEQVVAWAVEIADTALQVITAGQVELPGRLIGRPAFRFNDQQFPALGADLELDPLQERPADPPSLVGIADPDPVQVKGAFGQRPPTVAGKAGNLSIPAGDQKMIPGIEVAPGGEFGPQFFDDFDVVRGEQLNPGG